MKGYIDLVKLLKEVKATNAIDTNIEKICEYQDMIGHSAEEELAELANGNYKSEFYRVYALSYRIEDTIRFYRKHDNTILEMIEENEQLEDDNKVLEQKLVESKSRLDETERKLIEERNKNSLNAVEIDNLKAEIIKLKARLYDLINEK